MMKTRVLFVDDEPDVLAGLLRLLRPLRKDFDVRTAGSAAEALALLEVQSCDVIVSDMRMPGMDGAALLAIIKIRFPETVRIVLSGQTDRTGTLRVAQLAHQFLTKPCEPAELLDTLARVRNALGAMEGARNVVALGGSVGALPVAPLTWTKLMALLTDEQAAITEVGSIIADDPAIAGKLLQLTNSSFFGLKRRVSSIAEAVSYLGLSLVKNLVLAAGVNVQFPVRASQFDADQFQQHSMKTAHLARLVLTNRDHADDCFAAGLLHDVGRLLLASVLPERYDDISLAATAAASSFDDAEIRRNDGTTHVRLAVYVLNLWGLPWAVVEAIANQNHAPEVETADLGCAGAVYLAKQLLAEAAGPGDQVLDLAFIGRVGRLESVSEWRAKALEIARA